MNSRWRGTSTSSKITKASCSSNRLERGWEKGLGPVATLSRHRNFSRGALIGMQDGSDLASANCGSVGAGFWGEGTRRLATPLQSVARGRDHVADRDRLAGLGVGHQAGRLLDVLQVVDLGQRMGRAAQLGVAGHVGDALAVDPDLTLPA